MGRGAVSQVQGTLRPRAEPQVANARRGRALPLPPLRTRAPEDGREGRGAAVAKEPLVHELPLPGLLLSPQSLSLSCDIRWHHGQHAVLHVLQDAPAQVRGQSLDEGHRVHGGVRAGVLCEFPSLLLSPLLRQHLWEWKESVELGVGLAMARQPEPAFPLTYFLLDGWGQGGQELGAHFGHTGICDHCRRRAIGGGGRPGGWTDAQLVL